MAWASIGFHVPLLSCWTGVEMTIGKGVPCS